MKKYRFAFYIVSTLVITLFLVLLFQEKDVVVLHPKGYVAEEQKNLFLISTILMLIVVIPVIVLTFVFAWRYRENNPKANYRPDFNHSVIAEILWWGIPLIIIGVLCFYTWHYTHKLDPYKTLDTKDKKGLTIQVVALQWKWLFIYPEQNIATINYFNIPEKTPVTFEITADAPMNSFWLPELGGQIFAMPGMKTELNLIADQLGSFKGSSANISGKGFAGMTFTANSLTDAEFNDWIASVKQSTNGLDLKDYEKIKAPSEYNPEENFVLKRVDLFNDILMKYMMPMPNLSN
jgi:cytochrome o ubiquinol oxidase subunit 2